MNAAFAPLVLAGLSFCAFACTGKPAASTSPTTSPSRLAIDHMGPRSSCSFDNSQRIVVRDQATWNITWQRIYRDYSPVPAVPIVDFTSEMVVVVTMGTQPNTCHSIHIDDALAGQDGVNVTVRSVVPGPTCGCGQAITCPVDVARMPRANTIVTFTDTTSHLGCQ